MQYITKLVLANLILSVFSCVSVAATKVDVIKPKVDKNLNSLTLTGTVESYQLANLAVQQSGLVASIFIEAGDRVKKDQQILALDNQLAKLSLSQVKAELKAAKIEIEEGQRQYNEVLGLSKDKLIAKSNLAEHKAIWAKAQSSLQKKEAEVALQEEIVKRHILKAPFEGVITFRNVEVGEWITPQDDIINLVNHHALRIPVSIPQEYFELIESADAISVVLSFDDQAKTTKTQTISRIVPYANNQNRTFIAYINLDDSKNIIAGMSAKVDVQLPSDDSLLIWLPNSAIKKHPDGGRSVFAVVNNRAKRFIVKEVSQLGELIAVTGAPADYHYVHSGVELLVDGELLSANLIELKQ